MSRIISIVSALLRQVGALRQMTGFHYAKWRTSPMNIPSPVTTRAALCVITIFAALEASAFELPVPSVHEAFDDHPIVTLCIIFLLALLCTVLILSRSKIKESERRYRALFQDNGAIMLLIDVATMKVLDANPAACAFYGWSPADFLDKAITDINTLSETEVREIYHDVINFERRRYRARHRLASGEEREVEVNSMPYQIDGRECLLSIIHAIADERNGSGRKQ
jgi:PAS domain S-box-containing protein